MLTKTISLLFLAAIASLYSPSIPSKHGDSDQKSYTNTMVYGVMLGKSLAENNMDIKTTALELHINPPEPDPEFSHYLVRITPHERIIHTIIATRAFDSMTACELFLDNKAHTITSPQLTQQRHCTTAGIAEILTTMKTLNSP